MNTPWHYQSAREIRDAVRSGAVSATAMTEWHLDRIAEVDPLVDAFTQVWRDEALAQAAAVDEKALVKALREGTIAGAGLDVCEDEPRLAPGLADLENVVLLPHVGSATRETRMKMADLAVTNLLAGLRGDPPPNLVHPAGWEENINTGTLSIFLRMGSSEHLGSVPGFRGY